MYSSIDLQLLHHSIGYDVQGISSYFCIADELVNHRKSGGLEGLSFYETVAAYLLSRYKTVAADRAVAADATRLAAVLHNQCVGSAVVVYYQAIDSSQAAYPSSGIAGQTVDLRRYCYVEIVTVDVGVADQGIDRCSPSTLYGAVAGYAAS